MLNGDVVENSYKLFLKYIFILTKVKTVNTIAHQRTIIKVKTPAEILYSTKNYFILSKKSWKALHRGRRINIEILKFFSSSKFLIYWTFKPGSGSGSRIRDSDSTKNLDPQPDSLNPDLKPWINWYFLLCSIQKLLSQLIQRPKKFIPLYG